MTTFLGEWHGQEACHLQAALRLSNEAFAGRLGIAVRTVAAWHDKPETVPRTEMQQILDIALEQAGPGARERFRMLTGDGGRVPSGPQLLRVAIAVVLRADEVLLVCRRGEEAGNLTWQFPAGVVKPGADPETVAVRETLAETSVRCRVGRRLGSRVHPMTGVLCDYLLCEYLAGVAANADVVENVDVIWSPRDELTRFIPAETVFPPVLEVLKGRSDAE